MKNNIKFTLIELLVVIAIIAILASILMPALSSARKRAKTTTCTNNMKTVMLGYQQYGDQFDGITPLSMFAPVGMGSYSFMLRVLKYQTNFNASHCPETNPLGYIEKRKFSDKNGQEPHKVWRGVKQYEGVANWRENIAMDEFAYAVNYQCHNQAGVDFRNKKQGGSGCTSRQLGEQQQRVEHQPGKTAVNIPDHRRCHQNRQL